MYLPIFNQPYATLINLTQIFEVLKQHPKINKCSNCDQSIRISKGLFYTIKIKFKRSNKIF